MTFLQISETLEAQAEALTAESNRLGGQLDLTTQEVTKLRTRSESLEDTAKNTAAGLDVLRKYAELQEKTVRDRVEAIVTHGLRAVFEREDIGFGFRFELSRGQMTAVPVIRTAAGDGVVETEGTDGRGGGVLDVASFLLRCVMLVLYRPKLERILFLDEVFKCLSRSHLPQAADLVKQMSEKLKIQMVMVSHKDEFVESADRVFDVSIEDGETRIEQRG